MILDQRLAVEVEMNKTKERVEGQSDRKDYLWKKFIFLILQLNSFSLVRKEIENFNIKWLVFSYVLAEFSTSTDEFRL